MLRGLNPGRLDLLLTVEQKSLTPNSIGENVIGYSLYKQMFGSRVWEGGGEDFQNMQEVGTDKVKFTVRYDAELTNTMRIKEEADTTYFYIKSVNQWRREGYSVIIAERRDNQ